ncbi:metallophosphoesterase family protein [Mucilaginibacter sp. UYCu711]|uniref:metallophosphoesterase family protein n=1 Tax=Mucilaginibacter sp. UYCu711 TaxID=3156339 RepID=UPI003D249336
MKIAVISDIHGNSYALAEVLKTATNNKAEQLLVLGDICGYYYHTDKVWQLITEWDYKFIRGNHEEILLQLKNGEVTFEEIRNKYGSGHRQALDKMTITDIDYITTAPVTMDLIIDNVKIKMCHGSPMDSHQYLYPDTKKEILEQCDEEGFDFVLVGHSHYPFAYRNKNSILINVGSVGQSRYAGGIASWAIIDTKNKSFEIKNTVYNTSELIKEIELIDPDIDYLRSILVRSKS